VTDDHASADILVVEDDPSIQLGLRMNLEREGHRVTIADNGETGLEHLRTQSWGLVILDVMLPLRNGYEVLTAMRDEGISIPVLILSARGEEEEKVIGLDLGAEDYMTKPFGVRELLARVRVALRRNQNAPPSGGPTTPRIYRFGEVRVNLGTREVVKEGAPVELTVTEFNVLSALLRADGQALTREQIFDAVWGSGHHGTHRTIDNFIAQLRSKLEDNPTAPTHLLTVRGVGYRLCE
jgi:DNA-binding response OmpR family regulator